MALKDNYNSKILQVQLNAKKTKHKYGANIFVFFFRYIAN